MTTQTLSASARIRIATDLLFIVAFVFSFITALTYVLEYSGASAEEVIGTLSVRYVFEFLQGESMGVARWLVLLVFSICVAILMIFSLERLDPD